MWIRVSTVDRPMPVDGAGLARIMARAGERRGHSLVLMGAECAEVAPAFPGPRTE